MLYPGDEHNKCKERDQLTRTLDNQEIKPKHSRLRPQQHCFPPLAVLVCVLVPQTQICSPTPLLSPHRKSTTDAYNFLIRRTRYVLTTKSSIIEPSAKTLSNLGTLHVSQPANIQSREYARVGLVERVRARRVDVCRCGFPHQSNLRSLRQVSIRGKSSRSRWHDSCSRLTWLEHQARDW